MRRKTGLRLNLLALGLLLGVSSCGKTYITGHVDPARFHAHALLAGDFRTAWGNPPVPYHLARLIELGPFDSGLVLYELLDNTSSTPMHCLDGNIGFSASDSVKVCGERTATIGDLADWAMRRLYDVPAGVGYRGDLPPAQREEAIARWLKVAWDFEQDEYRRQQAIPERDTQLPGELFPGVD